MIFQRSKYKTIYDFEKASFKLFTKKIKRTVVTSMLVTDVGGKFETAARYLNIKKSPTSLWHNKFVNDRQGKFYKQGS